MKYRILYTFSDKKGKQKLLGNPRTPVNIILKIASQESASSDTLKMALDNLFVRMDALSAFQIQQVFQLLLREKGNLRIAHLEMLGENGKERLKGYARQEINRSNDKNYQLNILRTFANIFTLDDLKTIAQQHSADPIGHEAKYLMEERKPFRATAPGTYKIFREAALEGPITREKLCEYEKKYGQAVALSWGALEPILTEKDLFKHFQKMGIPLVSVK